MNKTTISLASVSILAIGFATAYAVYDYTTDPRRVIMEDFDDIEKVYVSKKQDTKQKEEAFKKSIEDEKVILDIYNKKRCALAFDKLAHNEPVSDETKDLCGIIKKDVDTKSTEDLSLAK